VTSDMSDSLKNNVLFLNYKSFFF